MNPFRLNASKSAILVSTLVTGALAAAELRRRARRRIASDHPDSAPARTSTALRRFGGYVVTGRSITINRSARAVYEFWRDFGNLAEVMENVKSVRTSGRFTEWLIAGPLGKTVRLETEIIEDRPGRLISWQSTHASDIDTTGKVLFHKAPAGRGTVVELIVAYKPPAGELGRAFARLSGKEPFVQARQDLRRLKMVMETGEIAHSTNYLSKEA